jgi:hypothetical protein
MIKQKNNQIKTRAKNTIHKVVVMKNKKSKTTLGLFMILLISSAVLANVSAVSTKPIIKSQSYSSINWVEREIIIPSGGGTSDDFGECVSIDGDIAIIGARQHESKGAAFIFKRSDSGMSWIQQAKLIASDGFPGQSFGDSVSICDNIAIVGAPCDDENGFRSGSAYIFDGTNGWSGTMHETAKLTARYGAQYDEFGNSVSIDENTAIVGAVYNDKHGENAGLAYIFEKPQTGWEDMISTKEITHSDSEADDYFGCSVEIDGDYVIVGAYGENNYTGSAYLFQRDLGGTDNWGEQSKLLASDHEIFDFFGNWVSISGTTAIVGAFFDDNVNGDDAGSAYIFDGINGGSGTIHETKILIPKEGGQTSYFGSGVSIDGDYAIVGAWYDNNINGYYAGSAHIFYRNEGGPDNWGEQSKLLASNGVPEDHFGVSVSIDEDYAIIGAYKSNNDIGSAYVFKQNEPPSWGAILGPTRVPKGLANYDFIASDPEGDDVQYIINWSDGSSDTLTNFVPSDLPHTVQHNWAKLGRYIISATVRDEHLDRGGMCTLTVSVPKSKTLSSPFIQFLQSHPNIFPLLQLLLQRLGL